MADLLRRGPGNQLFQQLTAARNPVSSLTVISNPNRRGFGHASSEQPSPKRHPEESGCRTCRSSKLQSKQRAVRLAPGGQTNQAAAAERSSSEPREGHELMRCSGKEKGEKPIPKKPVLKDMYLLSMLVGVPAERGHVKPGSSDIDGGELQRANLHPADEKPMSYSPETVIRGCHSVLQSIGR